MKKKILIIDDCLPILTSLRLVLDLYQFEVITAQDSSLLYEEQIPAEILLIDYHIPGMNGGKLFEQKKSSKKLPFIILMSGDPNIQQIAQTLPVDDFIEKPINIDELLNKLDYKKSKGLP